MICNKLPYFMMHEREFGAHCGFRTDHAVNLYTSPGMAIVVVVGWQIRDTEIVHIPTVTFGHPVESDHIFGQRILQKNANDSLSRYI